MKIRKDIMTDEELQLVAKTSDSLAHPLRVELFRFIYKKNLCRESVCNKDLVAEFSYAQSTISQHMAKLTESELIQVQKKGTANYYYVNLGMLGRYLDTVKKLNA
ncbi:MAG: winged helix-turn-helix transcriptional regulator [Firmicutes bacterium]|nr:winged helix-turn-helix transcriptional regulator [Bacillota bacterium]MBR6025551.1 winged helix-turn-helix transcriptional regulator [Bacillota bacterium]